MNPRCASCLFVPALLLAGCANWQDLSMTAPNMVEQDPLGCIVDLRSGKERLQGELIGLHQGAFVVMLESERMIPMDTLKVTEAAVLISRTSNNPNGYRWSAVLPFVSISHGAFGAITLPFNLIATITANTGAAKSRYAVEMPTPVMTGDLLPFARFPQGIPARYWEKHGAGP